MRLPVWIYMTHAARTCGAKQGVNSMIKSINAAEIHERQQNYVAEIEAQGFDYGLTVAKAFVESIRDLGYRSTGTAVNENVDNAGEAGAENVHVCFGFPDKSRKPNSIAILDDGIGMVPEMIRAATVWGGSDRHNSRDLYGRYGYGLPSSAVSQGRRFTVYSRVEGYPLHAVTIDLDDIAAGKMIAGGRVQIPAPTEAELPAHVVEYADEHFPGGSASVRTVILWEKLDRVTFRQADKLQNHLLETFGITYRNLLRNVNVVVNGVTTRPVDPLFLTESGRFFDLDDERAEPFEPMSFEVKDQETREVLGTVRLRFSVMSPTFGRVDKSKDARGKNANERFKILSDHNGLIVLRAGRQINVVSKGLPTSFGNNDRYVKVELDFPPSLDELFGVTTHKQQITLSDRMVKILEEHRVWKVLDRMRVRWRELNSDVNSAWDEDPQQEKRPSEVAIEEAAKLDPTAPQSEKRANRAEEGLERSIEGLVDQGVPRDQAEDIVETKAAKRPFRVDTEANPEGPFYRVELRGSQVVLLINTRHRFYTDVYAAVPGAEGARIRQSLEVLLFVLGNCEVDADEDREMFYKSERVEWSRRLSNALQLLENLMEAVPDASDEVAPLA